MADNEVGNGEELKMNEIVVDEKAFYGEVDSYYLLEGDNLKRLYEGICDEFSFHSHELDKGRYHYITGSYTEVVVAVDHQVEPNESISINFIPCIANSLFSSGARNLEDVVKRVAGENGFKEEELD